MPSVMRVKMLKFLLTILFINRVFAYPNNVCKTFKDYRNIVTSRNCWYDADVDSTEEQIVTRYGLRFEHYNLTTHDGYILKIFRIPSPIKFNWCMQTRKPMLFYHGLNRDSRCFLLRGALSPAIYFAKRGYDVWLANTRGTRFSIKHVYLTADNPKYWDFDIHSLGYYDSAAIVDFIAEKTHQKGNIIYVGHSLGTTTAFVHAISRPEHFKENIKGIIALAPVAKMDRMKFPGIQPLSYLSAQILKILQKINTHVLNLSFIFNNCGYYPGNLVCKELIESCSGQSSEHIYPEIIPIFTKRGNAFISTKILAHISQTVNNKGTFKRFDYGSQKNIEMYNSKVPPTYNFSKIDVPVHLIYSNNDYFSPEEDVRQLFREIRSTKSLTKIPRNKNIKLAHGDFLFGKNIKEHVFSVLENVLVSLK